MTTVLDFMKRLEKVNIMELAAEAMYNTRTEYIKWQQQQMRAGKLSTGADIKPRYARRTIFIKIKKGQPYDRVTLKDTGDFYKGVFIDVRDRTFVVDSTDWKSYKLMLKYSKNIFILGTQYKNGYLADFYPVFMNLLKKKLGLI